MHEIRRATGAVTRKVTGSKNEHCNIFPSDRNPSIPFRFLHPPISPLVKNLSKVEHTTPPLHEITKQIMSTSAPLKRSAKRGPFLPRKDPLRTSSRKSLTQIRTLCHRKHTKRSLRSMIQRNVPERARETGPDPLPHSHRRPTKPAARYTPSQSPNP